MTPTNEKLVTCLYRVSTTKQMDDDDIPMQQTACKKLISQHNDWILTNEYYEKGISAYKTAIADRDIIQNIIKEAQTGKFQILVLFASDRLCRNDNYMPTLKKISKYVEVWTYTQGDITIRNHTDALKASIDGWSNEGESIKISLRTDEKHKQMAEDGEFRGGSNPYGYKFIKSGRYSTRDKKQRKELFDMVIDKNESEVVKTIFNLAYELGYGGNRIANYLNENNIPTRENKKWSLTSVNYLLKNPVYKGYPAYGKKTCKDGQINQSQDKWVLPSKQIKNLVIITEDIWNAVSLMRKSRYCHTPKEETINTPTKGKLLLVGFIKCGYCGSPLVTTHNTKKWIKQNGEEKHADYLKYRCYGKQSGKTKCNGRSVYAQEKIETPVLQYIDDFFSQLENYDFSKDINFDNSNNIKQYKNEVDNLSKNRNQKNREIELLNDEILKTILGDSPYTKEQLSTLIIKKEKELDEIQVQIGKIEDKLKFKQNEVKDIKALVDIAPSWKEIFYNAPFEKQKMILSSLIESVVIYKDKYDINVKIHIQQFVNCMLNNIKWESTLYTLTPKQIFEKLIIINLENLSEVG